MAFLVPDNLGSRKDVSESIRRVAKAFQTGLDDDVTVWYEPLFDPTNEHPHLVILEPRLGIIVLEVLKGKQSSLLGAIRGRLRLEIDGDEVEIDNPLQRAERFAAAVAGRIIGNEGLNGTRVGSVAVLSGMTREEAEDKRIGSVVDFDRTIFRTDLDRALSDGDGAAILRVLSRATSDVVPRDELTSQQINQLRGIIHPDVLIQPAPEQGSLFTALVDDDVVKVMDRRQEAMAKSLGSGHRVIRGVAGSGKTLVLMHRARLLARVLPNQRILLTCYTKALAGQLRTHLVEYPNIEVVNLDSLMAKTISAAGMKHPGFSPGAKPVAKAALEAVERGGAHTYRAVLVDEAQDFDTEALEFCRRLLGDSDPEQQDLVIVADSAQNIFRKNFRWKDAGIQAQGRTRILRINYRNTRQVLEFAHEFLTADDSINIDEVPGDEDELTIVPAQSAERDGPSPTVTITADVATEVEAVVAAVKAHLTNRSTSRSVAVLYGEPSPGEMSRGASVAAALTGAHVPHFWVTDPKQTDNKHFAGSTDEPVVVSTIASAKGLEYPNVIVCGLGAREDQTTARKLLYVGFTRATHTLHVVTHKNSPFCESLPRSV